MLTHGAMCTTTEQKSQAPGHEGDLFDSGDEKSRVRYKLAYILQKVIGSIEFLSSEIIKTK